MATEVYYYGRGRRKTASARVRLYPGDGKIIVNDRPADRYFGREIDLRRIMEPLVVAGVEGRFDVVAKVEGGGVTGQADAVRHGVARALVAFDPALRPRLREAGLLTRDPRAKERKKPGLKRARKAPQYTKR